MSKAMRIYIGKCDIVGSDRGSARTCVVARVMRRKFGTLAVSYPRETELMFADRMVVNKRITHGGKLCKAICDFDEGKDFVPGRYTVYAQ